jgi:hypothetical protein
VNQQTDIGTQDTVSTEVNYFCEGVIDSENKATSGPDSQKKPEGKNRKAISRFSCVVGFVAMRFIAQL